MSVTDWIGRLAGIGATPNEQVAIAASYYEASTEVQGALDTLIDGIDSGELRVMLTTWRTSGAPFHAGYPGGGLPFGAGVPVLTGNPADDVEAIGAGTGVKIPVNAGMGVTVASTGATQQGQVPALDALSGLYKADKGVYSPRGDRGIVVVNSAPDPRATNSANFKANPFGAATITQNPTSRADGFQQAASPKSCQEVVFSLPVTSDYGGITTNFGPNGSFAGGPLGPILVNPNRPMVAAQAAFKISGTLGTGWLAQLWVFYFRSDASFVIGYPVWSGGPNQITLGQWFATDIGFDAQMTAVTNSVELGLIITGATAGNPITLRMTEIVIALDPDGDVPGYVGGDLPGGGWKGTADASASAVSFDPVSTYPVKDLGTNSSFEFTNGDYTQEQGVAMHRAIGASVVRVDCPSTGGNPAAPTVPSNIVNYIEAHIQAGVKVLLDFGLFPEWMAPTHFGLVQSGNGGSISSGATSANVTGSLPANLTLPCTFQWADGSSEVATLTSVAGGVAHFTRGAGATSHNDAVRLIDAKFNVTFGHVYYPDPAYRATWAQTIVNLIAQVSTDTGIPAATWCAGVEIYNEPNLLVDDTRNEGAAGYTALCNVANAAVTAAYPTIPLMLGVLANEVGAGGGGNIAPDTFLAGMVSAGITIAAKDFLDCHFYTGGTGTIPTSALGAGSTGFDPTIKQIKDKLVALGLGSTQIYVSETGNAAWFPDERTQAQATAMCVGRLMRDPHMAAVIVNGLAQTGANGYGPFDGHGLRPRPLARQLALMRGVQPPAPASDELARWVPHSSGYLYLEPPAQALGGPMAGSFAIGPEGQAIIFINEGGPVTGFETTIDAGGLIRSIGTGVAPPTGKGAEIFADNLGRAWFQGWDRSGAAAIPVIINGSTIKLNAPATAAAGLEVLSTGELTRDGGGGAQTRIPSFMPVDAGLKFATHDPLDAASTIQPAAGFIYLFKIWVPANTTIANLLVLVATAGATLTTGQNFMGVYDQLGNLWELTADQHTPWQSTGLKTMALTAQGSFSLTLNGGVGFFYWLSILCNGTTTPLFAAKKSQGITAQPGLGFPYATTVPGAIHRAGYVSTGSHTSLPSSLTGLTITDSGLPSMAWIGVT